MTSDNKHKQREASNFWHIVLDNLEPSFFLNNLDFWSDVDSIFLLINLIPSLTVANETIVIFAFRDALASF